MKSLFRLLFAACLGGFAAAPAFAQMADLSALQGKKLLFGQSSATVVRGIDGAGQPPFQPSRHPRSRAARYRGLFQPGKRKFRSAGKDEEARYGRGLGSKIPQPKHWSSASKAKAATYTHTATRTSFATKG